MNMSQVAFETTCNLLFLIVFFLLREEVLALVVIAEGKQPLIGQGKMRGKRVESSHDLLHTLFSNNLLSALQFATVMLTEAN